LNEQKTLDLAEKLRKSDNPTNELNEQKKRLNQLV
jgi:hypothetical protein